MARILIADVDKNTCSLLKSELEGIGYVVDIARQGTITAADGAVTAPCDALLIDMQVPSLDYFNKFKRIKQDNPLAHIIVFSNSHASEEKENLKDAGADVCFARHEIGSLIAYLRNFRLRDSLSGRLTSKQERVIFCDDRSGEKKS